MRRRSKPETALDLGPNLVGLAAADLGRQPSLPLGDHVAVDLKRVLAHGHRAFPLLEHDPVAVDRDRQLIAFVDIEQATRLCGNNDASEVVDLADHCRVHVVLLRIDGSWPRPPGSERVTRAAPSLLPAQHPTAVVPSPALNAPTAPRHILVAVAWPYAQGSLHLGHIAGAYLPPDVFARYHRAIGNRVLMVSGSDVHGTPITVKAEAEGVSPEAIVDRYHPEFLGYWDYLGIDFDLFTTTGTDNHKRVVQEFFLKLLENGYLYTAKTDQFYDEEAGRFLPDRYIEGTCPHCGYEFARGDQCDNCQRTLDPTDLIAPRSTLSGSTPVLRETEHYYWKLSAFQDQLLEWLRSRSGWRAHVLNFSVGFVEEGLHDRAFSRDLEWGIPLPVDDLGPGKSIYVWWEAVMGYYSAPQEWAKRQGDPEAWRRWWEDPDAESYYFVGKDNIPFHAIYWPALLMGHGGLNLPTDVPANQFVTFKGEKASKSRGVGKPLPWYFEHFEPDALRFAITRVLPETNDTDLTEDELVRKVNDELVATWGNLVNRVVSMTHRYFDGIVPQEGDLDDADESLLEKVDGALAEAGDLIASVRLRAALSVLMGAAQAANGYLSDREPWLTAKTDLDRTGTTLHVALNAVSGLAAGLAAYLPFTSRRVLSALNVKVPPSGPAWNRAPILGGNKISELTPLFARVELPVDGAD